MDWRVAFEKCQRVTSRPRTLQKFQGAKVLGLFAPRERMFQRTKVPRKRKFSLWTFRSRERKCRGTRSPDTSLPRCTKCNSPAINSQCTNFVWHYKYLCQLNLLTNTHARTHDQISDLTGYLPTCPAQSVAYTRQQSQCAVIRLPQGADPSAQRQFATATTPR